MNIFNKITLQSMKKSGTRTFVTLIGVVLSAAMITAVITFAVSLQRYMINGAIEKYGDWHIQFPRASANFLLEQLNDKRISEVVALENLGYSVLKDGKNPDKPYIFVSGWNEEAMEQLPITLLSGRLPENSSEILIPAHIAANGGVKFSVGDTITLSMGNRMKGNEILNQHDPYSFDDEKFVPLEEKTYSVVGISQRPAIEEFSAPGYTVITKESAFESDNLTVFIKLKNPYQIGAYVDEVSNEHGYVLNEDVLRFMGLSGEKFVTVLLFSIGSILISLVMVGSVFLIYNSFNISLNKRTSEFGILMSIGATEKQLRNSVMFEGFCIGLIGIPVGILIGIPSIKFVLTLVAKNFANVLYDNVALTLLVSVPALILTFFISMVTILISAYIPAKKAVSMPIMDCIRQINTVKVDSKNLKTSKFAEKIYGIEQLLAIKNYKRNRQRYRSIILSLALSVVLFVAASSFGVYLHQIAESSAIVVEDYDICFYSNDLDEQELFTLYDEMKSASAVEKSSFQALLTYSASFNRNDGSTGFIEEFGDLIGYDGVSETIEALVDVQFVEDGVYSDLLNDLGLSIEDYSGQDKDMIMVGILPDHLYLQEDTIDYALHSENGDLSMPIQARFVTDFPDMLPADSGEKQDYRLMLIAPYDDKAQFDGLLQPIKPATLGMTFQSENPKQSTTEMQMMLDRKNITADYQLYNLYEILEPNRNLTFIVNLFSTVFIAMISLIAIANVFNTISTNIKLRRREFAMLRSVGMSEKDFNKMMSFECVLYGIWTMVWGLPISGILSFLIYQGMIRGGGELSFLFPWQSMTISVFSVFLLVFITMVYAVSEIRKENIIDALRDDLT